MSNVSLIVVVVVLVVLVTGAIGLNNRLPDPGPGLEPHFCSISQREAEFCLAVYEPVCGWFDTDKVQCIRYPCAVEQSNSCFACMDDTIAFWTEGKCPSL